MTEQHFWMLIHQTTEPAVGEHLPGAIDGDPLEGFATPHTIQITPLLEEQVDTELDELALAETVHLVRVSPLGYYTVDANGAAVCDDGWRIARVGQRAWFFGPRGFELVRLCRLLRDYPSIAEDLAGLEAESVDALDPIADRAREALRTAGSDADSLPLSDGHQYSQLALLAGDLLSDDDEQQLREPLRLLDAPV